jgi:hypothetical protein
VRNTRNFLCTSDAGQVRRLGLDLLRAPEPHALCKEAAKSPLPPRAAVHAMTKKGEGEAAGALACIYCVRIQFADLKSLLRMKFYRVQAAALGNVQLTESRSVRTSSC